MPHIGYETVLDLTAMQDAILAAFDSGNYGDIQLAAARAISDVMVKHEAALAQTKADTEAKPQRHAAIQAERMRNAEAALQAVADARADLGKRQTAQQQRQAEHAYKQAANRQRQSDVARRRSAPGAMTPADVEALRAEEVALLLEEAALAKDAPVLAALDAALAQEDAELGVRAQKADILRRSITPHGWEGKTVTFAPTPAHRSYKRDGKIVVESTWDYEVAGPP